MEKVLNVSLQPMDKAILDELRSRNKKTPVISKQYQRKNGNTYENIVRRGLHSVRYLQEIELEKLIELLGKYIHSAERSPNFHSISIASYLSSAVHATMISKFGITESEPFEIFPKTLTSLAKSVNRESKGRQESIIKDNKRYLKNISAGLNTLASNLDKDRSKGTDCEWVYPFDFPPDTTEIPINPFPPRSDEIGTFEGQVSDFHESVDKEKIIWRFNLNRFSEETGSNEVPIPIPVVMRLGAYKGNINEGHQIRIRGKWKQGINLLAFKAYNKNLKMCVGRIWILD